MSLGAFIFVGPLDPEDVPLARWLRVLIEERKLFNECHDRLLGH